MCGAGRRGFGESWEDRARRSPSTPLGGGVALKWGAVTSNRIEGRISQIKLRLPRRGQNSEEAVKRRLAAILSEPKPREEEDWADTPPLLPSFPHLGLVNLGEYITPQIEAIEVTRA